MAVAGNPSRIISDNYFDTKHFPKNSTNNIICKMYDYSSLGVLFNRDISDKIIDYSYECDSAGNIRQTASITIKVDTNDDTWYMRRENKMFEWINDDKSIQALTWAPQIYQLIKTYQCGDDDSANQPKELNLGYFIPTSDGYNFDSTTGTLSINLQGLSTLLSKEYGGSVLTARVGTTYIDSDTHKPITKMFPLTMSIDEGVAIDSQMFYELAMGGYGHSAGIFNITAQIPLKKDVIIEYGQKLYNTPYDIDFDADVGRADMIQEVIDTAFEGAVYWIDENRYLRISSKPETRGNLVAHWRDYCELFISESISYDDSNFFNVTEVYGKDNNYYAICDESHLDGGYAGVVRKQILQFDELTSVEECQERANWENYKARYGRQNLSVTLADRYIPQFTNPSSKVGKTIEYTTVDGDTNLYFLNKLSYSHNTWTMDLSIFKPLYNTVNIRSRYTLSKPFIVKHEVIDNSILRLYISGEDINYGAVKIYVDDVAAPTFRSVSVKTLGNYKIADVPISENGTYYCYASLYSPFYEDSPINGKESALTTFMTAYEAVVTEIKYNDNEHIDNDPYPHPIETKNDYLTDENGNALVTENNKLIILRKG